MAVITDNFTLPDFGGDAGAGGTHGLVPAPAAGDGTDKFLKADGTWSSTPEIQEDPGAGVGLIEANTPGGPTVLKNVRDGQGTKVIANTGSFQTDVHFSAPNVAFVSDALGDPTEVPVAETSGSEVIVRALPTGKIDLSFIPDSILGQVEYQGVWNASTNTPTLANPPASTTKGDFYIANVAGTQFGINFAVGDWIISDGTAWSKVDNTDAVASVFGRVGPIVAANGDYNAGQVTNTPAGDIAATTVQAALNELDTEKQPANSDLKAIAELTPANGDVIQRKAGSWVNRTMAQLWADLLSLASAVFIPVARASISVLPVSNDTSTTWNAMPSALTFFNGAGRNQISVDLTDAKRVRFSVGTGATGFAGAKLVVRYRTFAAGYDPTPANWNVLGASSTEVETLCDTVLTFTTSGYINIEPSAKTTVLIGLFGKGGNAVANPTFMNATIDVEYAP